MKKAIIIVTAIIIIAATIGVLYVLGVDFSWKKSGYDTPDQENKKMVEMFNAQIKSEIDNHTKSSMHPGYREESRQNTINYLSTIKSIESYARYGVTSTRVHNKLELKIMFNNGKSVEDVYTGLSVSGIMKPALLMRVEMRDGKAVQIFTNGQEKTGSPDWIIPDLRLMINAAISYDIGQNYEHYFPAQKTEQDFQKEWDTLK